MWFYVHKVWEVTENSQHSYSPECDILVFGSGVSVGKNSLPVTVLKPLPFVPKFAPGLVCSLAGECGGCWGSDGTTTLIPGVDGGLLLLLPPLAANR